MTATDARGERPVIFSAQDVIAAREGRKTQHRVVLKLPPKQFEHPKMGGWEPTVNGGGGCFRIGRGGERIPVPETVGIWHRTTGYCADAPHQVGDRIWVKEAIGRRPASFLGIEADNGVESAFYRADDEDVLNEHDFNLCPWWAGKSLRPDRCPRWASRLTLIVEAVKVERLAEISDADARAEGFEAFGPDIANPHQDGPTGDAADAFAAYWDSIHGKGSFEASPWVAVISFQTLGRNIDCLLGGRNE